MEKLDTIARIVELVLAVVTSAVITRIITIRQRVRQEHAAADKAEADVKKDQIENIEAIVEKVYKPTIDTLTRQVADLRAEVDAVRKENEELKQEIAAAVSDYQNIVVTSETEKDSKALRAKLNKLRTAIETARKDMKGRVMEPLKLLPARMSV